MYEDNLYMSNLFEFFDRHGAPPRAGPSGWMRAEEGIRFVDVGFRFPATDG